MKTTDLGAMIVIYNLIIGVLLMLASDKIASYARRLSDTFGRYARVSLFTFGSCVAVLSGTMYLAFHIFRIGLD